jgi:uncharacterized protein (DUF927 family)
MKEDLGRKLLSHPDFANFKHIGGGEWRDTTEENPSLSISLKKGTWFDHRQNKGGPLIEFVKKYFPEEYSAKKCKNTALFIYEQSTQTKADLEFIQKYLKSRFVPFVEIEELKKMGCKVNRYNSKTSIVLPSKNSNGQVVQVLLIQFKNEKTLEREGKKKIGTYEGDHAFIFGNPTSEKTVIYEGFEKAIAHWLLNEQKEKMIVTGGKSGFSHINSFLSDDNSLVLDNDQDNGSLKQSICLENKVRRFLPANTGEDLNDALEKGTQKEWFGSLKEIRFDELKEFFEEESKKEEIQNNDDYIPIFFDGVPEGFRVTKTGIYRQEKELYRICNTLKIVALARNSEDSGWSKILEFDNFLGVKKRILLENSLLASDGSALRSRLNDEGFQPVTDRDKQLHLIDYIALCKPSKLALTINRNGWHGKTYVRQNEQIHMDTPKEELFLTNKTFEHFFRESGSLEDWRENVAKLCSKNNLPIFALSSAFASVLLRPLGLEGGGFHFVGRSSIGKTTLLHLAGSVFGGSENGYIRNWRNTGNAVESIASQHCDSLLCLDEIGQIPDKKELGEIAYMLSNGYGKGRTDRNGQIRQVKEWKLLFLSTGEKTLSEAMEEAGKDEFTKAGQSVRFVDLSVDISNKFGIFNSIPNSIKSSAELANSIKKNSKKYYGTPILRFLFELPNYFENLEDSFKVHQKAWIEGLEIENADSQILRVVDRFAVVAFAGALACQMGILPFDSKEVYSAVGEVLKNWLKERAKNESDMRESLDTLNGFKRVRSFLQAHQESRFTALDSSGKPTNENAKTSNRCGFTKEDEHGNMRFLIFPEQFRKEICKGFDSKEILRLLDERGFLDRSDKLSKTVRIFGKVNRFYDVSFDFLIES